MRMLAELIGFGQSTGRSVIDVGEGVGATQHCSKIQARRLIMTIEKTNTMLVSTGSGILIAGLVVLFVGSFLAGMIMTMVGMITALVGAIMFQPS